MDVRVGDILHMKKSHPCGGNIFDVLRIGADFRIRCSKCGREVMLERGKVAFNIGDVEVTAPEYGFYYASAFNNYFQYSYQYDTYYGAGMGKLYTGYDYSKMPAEQKFSGEIEGVEDPTFADYFSHQAIESMKYVKAWIWGSITSHSH